MNLQKIWGIQSMMINGNQDHPDQKETIERLLDDEQVLVHINPAVSGLVLPEHLKDSRTVTLRLSRYFKGDLFTDESKVSAQLLFGAEYFTCDLPWVSIWGASSVRGEEFLWPDAAPAEILEMALSQQERQASGKVPPFISATSKSSSTSESPVVGRKSRSNGGHLRRVK